ncbi:MAG: histidine kinase dimerization/phosphoacceptor domain -containing protein, partial [Spirochaetia bacterium]
SVLFERTSERVMSMAMVHEQLHHTDDLSLIPFDRYLADLIEHIRGSSTTDAVDIRVDCEPISLEIHRAVPCGLIVNELVMNALQHAFEKDRAGTIEVYLHRRGERYELGVRDSGAGMPAGVSKSLGMTLVEMLSEQLEATLEVSPGTDTGSGTSITLSFPV